MATTKGNDDNAPNVIYTLPLRKAWPKWAISNMCLEVNGVKHPVTWKNAEGAEAEPVVQWPFSVETLDKICSDYLVKSPYFYTLFSDYRRQFGDKVWQDVMNDYFSDVQYKKGTLTYYADYLFDTRKHRDIFAEFIRSRQTVIRTVAHAMRGQPEIVRNVGVLDKYAVMEAPEGAYPVLLDSFNTSSEYFNDQDVLAKVVAQDQFHRFLCERDQYGAQMWEVNRIMARFVAYGLKQQPLALVDSTKFSVSLRNLSNGDFQELPMSVKHARDFIVSVQGDKVTWSLVWRHRGRYTEGKIKRVKAVFSLTDLLLQIDAHPCGHELSVTHVPSMRVVVVCPTEAHVRNIFSHAALTSNQFLVVRRSGHIVVWTDKRAMVSVPRRTLAHSKMEDQSSMEQVQNVKFIAQTDTVHEDMYRESQLSVNTQRETIPEKNWHTSDILNKPMLEYDFTWTSAQASQAVVLEVLLPGNPKSSIHTGILKQFNYFRSDIHVKIQVTGNKFQCGQLIAAFVPGLNSKVYVSTDYNLASTLMGPHVKITPVDSNVAELTIPYVHMSNFFNVHDKYGFDWLGKLIIWVLNPLSAPATVASTVEGSVWISFVNSALHQPSMEQDVMLPSILERTARTQAHAGKQLEHRIVPVAVPDINYGASTESTRLSLHKGSENVIPSKYSKVRDDMDLKKVFETPVLISTFTWNATSAATTSLFTRPVCPTVTGSNVYESPDNVVTPNGLAYNARMFKYWRGGLTYTFEVMCSDFHRGKLLIGYTTGKQQNTYNYLLGQNVASIDIGTEKTTKLTVPYTAHRHWMRADKFIPYDALDPDGEYGVMYTSTLRVHVQNRLSCPDTVSGSVQVNVFVQAAPDFEVAFPTDLSFLEDYFKEGSTPRKGYRLYLQNGTTSSESPTKAHAQKNEERREDKQTDMLIAGSGIVASNTSIMGESHMDMSSVLQRYECVADVNSLLTLGVGRQFSMYWLNTPMLGSKEGKFDGTSLQFRTKLAHYSQQFMGWDGSLSYIMVVTSSDPGITVDLTHVPGIFPQTCFKFVDTSEAERYTDRFQLSLAALGSLVGTTDRQSFYSITVPAYKPYDMLRVHPDINAKANAQNTTGMVVARFKTTTDASRPFTVCVKVYQAAREDFRLFGLIGPPRMRLKERFEMRRIVNDYPTGMFKPVTKSNGELQIGDGVEQVVLNKETVPKPEDPEPEYHITDDELTALIVGLPPVEDVTQVDTYQQLIVAYRNRKDNLYKVTSEALISNAHADLYLPRRYLNNFIAANSDFYKGKNFKEALDRSNVIISIRSPKTYYINLRVSDAVDGWMRLFPKYFKCYGRNYTDDQLKKYLSAPLKAFSKNIALDWSDPKFKSEVSLVRIVNSQVDIALNDPYIVAAYRAFEYYNVAIESHFMLQLGQKYSGNLQVWMDPTVAHDKALREMYNKYKNNLNTTLLDKRRIAQIFVTGEDDKMVTYLSNGQDGQNFRFLEDGRKATRLYTGDIEKYVGDLNYPDPWLADDIVQPVGSENKDEDPTNEQEGSNSEDGGKAHAKHGDYGCAQSWNPITNVNTTMSSVKQMCDEVSSSIADLKALIKGSDDEDEPPDDIVDRLLSGFATSLSDLGTELKSTNGLLGWTVSIANVITGFNSFVSASSIVLKVSAIITLTSEMLGIATVRFRNFLAGAAFKIVETLSQLKGSRNEGNELRTVGHAAALDFIPAVIALVATGALVSGFASIPDDVQTIKIVKGVTERLKLFNFSCSAVQNLKNTYLMLKDLVTSATESVLEFCAPTLLAQMKLADNCGEIERWAQFIDQVDQDTYVERCNWDLKYKNELGRAYDLACKYSEMLIRGSIGKEAHIVREYVRKITLYWTKAQKAWHALPFRPDPFCVCVFGHTKVGKSAVVLDMVNELADSGGFPVANRIVPINCTESFFTENYQQQLAVLMDDVGAFKTIEQWEQFFLLKSNSACSLNMAFKKGEFFNSRIIMQTTNIQYPTPTEMNDLKALWRRRDKLIQMEYVDEATRQAAMDGLRPHKEDYSHAKFKFFCPYDSDPDASALNPWLTYEEMMAHLKRAFYEHTVTQEHLTRTMLKKYKYIPPPGLRELPLLPPSNDGCLRPSERFRFIGKDRYSDRHNRVSLDTDIHIVNANMNHFEVPSTTEVQQVLGELRMHEESEKFFDAEDAGSSHGVSYTLDFDAICKDPQLAVYQDIIEHLEWQESTEGSWHGKFVLKQSAPPEIVEAFQEAMEAYRGSYVTFEDHIYRFRLVRNSRIANCKQRLSDCVSYFRDCCTKGKDYVSENFPLLRKFLGWPLKLTLALGALVSAGVIGKSIIHRCVCKSIRGYGFRCAKCGRWPKLADGDQEWLLAQWRSLKGKLPYVDGYEMSLEEERMYKSMRNETVEEIIVGTEVLAHGSPYPSGRTMGARPMRVMANIGNVRSDVVLPQTFAQQGKQAQALIDYKFKNHIYRLSGNDRRGVPWYINGVAIGGRKVLVPKHFFEVIGDTISIFHSGAWMTVIKDMSKTMYQEGKDIVCFEFPIQFHLHKDLSRHFVKEADLDYLVKTPSVLLELTASGEYNNFHLMAERIDNIHYELDMDDNVTSKIAVTGAWRYNICTAPGSCGSMLVTTSDKVTGRILGLHTAGNEKYGYSQLFTQEMISKFLGDSPKLGTPLPAIEEGVGVTIPHGHLGVVGALPLVQGVRQPVKTDIIPTPIQGLISEPATFPTVLSRKDPRLSSPINVGLTAVSKYGVVPQPLNETHLGMIFESLEAEISTWELPRRPSVLTMEQAICGLEYEEGYERLPLNTSPGWPWCLSRQKPGKLEFISEDGVPSPELVHAVDCRERLAQCGERICSVWTCCLKDERRSWAKIVSGNTRMFVIGPLDFSIMCRKYTLDFIETMKFNRSTSFCQLGIDPQSLEWQQLYNRLSNTSSFVIAGDYTNYDGSLHPQLVEKFMEHVDSFYRRFGEWSVGDSKVRRVILDEVIHTPLLLKNSLYVKHCGNPSGSPLTTAENSVVNYYYMSLAWLALVPDEFKTMAKFRESVNIAVFGDDNILAVKGEFLKWYNQETIATFLSTIGIVYTNATKTGLTKYMKLGDSTFLKQGFGMHKDLPGTIVPLMDKKTILELLNWTREAPDQDALLQDNCNDALRFAYFYGKEYFVELRDKIVQALTQVNKKNLFIMTYSDFHYWFLWVLGKLHSVPIGKAHAFLERVAAHGNGPFARIFNKIVFSIPYKCISKLGVLQSSGDRPRTDDRYAYVIPSGEGKSWLARNYPSLFIDHDDLLLPRAGELLKDSSVTWKSFWEGLKDCDVPIEDRRILLTHHENNTGRAILGKYILPEPVYIRANAYQRLRIRDPEVIGRDDRNAIMISRARSILGR